MNSIDVALICKALGDTNRLQIIEILSACDEKCACKLLEYFQITQPTLSYHMKLLEECDLVKTRRDGKWNHYSINKKTLCKFKKYIKNLCCDKEEK
ncbi:MAG: metalloregulator ArsR/SmtB family transcription factor [Treponemataceae bacterium]